ncbi:MAG: hypothetical protein ACTSVI_06120 [Promethearchaeota archaeon]
MAVKIKKVEYETPCMDCVKYSTKCNHLNNFVADIRSFVNKYNIDKNIEITLSIDCKDKELC